MKRNKIYMICMILAGILFFGSVGAIVRIYMSYREGEQVYEELEEYVREPESTKEPEGEKPSEENSAFPFLQVDFASLQNINPEVIAWIQIPALDISYPVAKGTDNAYYLQHMINGETNKSGSIFMDYHNQEDFTDRNTIIYGHNMRDGSMFGTLEKYQDQEFTMCIRSFMFMCPAMYMNITFFLLRSSGKSCSVHIFFYGCERLSEIFRGDTGKFRI